MTWSRIFNFANMYFNVIRESKNYHENFRIYSKANNYMTSSHGRSKPRPGYILYLGVDISSCNSVSA